MPVAAADPTINTPSPREGLATWTFSNPANYTTSNVSLSFGSLSLAKVASTAGDSVQGEFAQALTLDNVDLASSPGDVAVQNTSQPGPPNALVYQANPAQLDDNYLRIGGGGNTNFGASPGLLVGYWGIPEWNRAILHWPALPLPSNATLVSARLELYMYGAATPDAMEISVHQMTTGWTELGSTWNDYDGSNAWNASGGGGDFDPTPIDAVAGITNATGWVSWNVTAPARDWWNPPASGGRRPGHPPGPEGLLQRRRREREPAAAPRPRVHHTQLDGNVGIPDPGPRHLEHVGRDPVEHHAAGGYAD